MTTTMTYFTFDRQVSSGIDIELLRIYNTSMVEEEPYFTYLTS